MTIGKSSRKYETRLGSYSRPLNKQLDSLPIVLWGPATKHISTNRSKIVLLAHIRMLLGTGSTLFAIPCITFYFISLGSQINLF